MQEEKSMLIVGAGIAGLSAGYYASVNGYRAVIFEQHNIPGGLCTAWERKGYKFDISMHMLTGSLRGPIHRMWQELGVMEGRRFHYHDLICRIESGDKALEFTTDPVQLEQQMTALSPGDARLTRQFIRLIFGPDMMSAASLKPAKLQNLSDRMKLIRAIAPLIGTFMKYKQMTIQEFAARFRDPFLRDAVRFFIDSPGWPMTGFPMVALAGFIQNGVTGAGVPIGGSQQVVFRMAENFTRLGGEIRYKSRVKDLIIENDRVVGVMLEDGSEHRADHVIWAGDGHTLIFDILGGRYINERIQDMYSNWIPVKPMVHVMLGVNRDLSAEPHRILLKLDKPFSIAGREHHWMSVIHHCFDPTMAPPGRSAVEVWFDTEYGYWEELARDRKKYKAEKERIAQISIDRLEQRWPGFASQVEVVDVPTPATYVRYTGNWQGSPDGWYITPANMSKQEPLRTLPGLKGLQMIGQWTAPFTGTVIAAMTGRQALHLLCREEGRNFITG